MHSALFFYRREYRHPLPLLFGLRTSWTVEQLWHYNCFIYIYKAYDTINQDSIWAALKSREVTIEFDSIVAKHVHKLKSSSTNWQRHCSIVQPVFRYRRGRPSITYSFYYIQYLPPGEDHGQRQRWTAWSISTWTSHQQSQLCSKTILIQIPIWLNYSDKYR